MALVKPRPNHPARSQDHLLQTDVSDEMTAATTVVRRCFSPHGLPALKYSGSNVSAALALIVDGAAGSFDVCGMRQMTTDFRQVAVTHSQHLLVAGEAQPLPPRLTWLPSVPTTVKVFNSPSALSAGVGTITMVALPLPVIF